MADIKVDHRKIAEGIVDMLKPDDRAVLAIGMIPESVFSVFRTALRAKVEEVVPLQDCKTAFNERELHIMDELCALEQNEKDQEKIRGLFEKKLIAETLALRKAIIEDTENRVASLIYTVAKERGILIV